MSSEPTMTCPSGETCRLIADVDALKKEVLRLSELINHDTLTGLFNYRHFSHHLEQEIERSQRARQPTSLIMLDIDHFKSVNDEWGHEVGNQALQLIAKCIINNVRKLDIACRYGGEEFAVILPGSDIITSKRVAERIRHSIEMTPLIINACHGNEGRVMLTVSAGVSMYSGIQQSTAKQLVENADERLYQSKKNGRNRVSCTTEESNTQQISQEERSALLTVFNNKNDNP